MITFLEYFKGNPIINPKIPGKDPDRVANRKHVNTKAKEYKQQHIGSATVLKGDRLKEMLASYGIDITDIDIQKNNVFGLGNSKKEIVLTIDPNNILTGQIRDK